MNCGCVWLRQISKKWTVTIVMVPQKHQKGHGRVVPEALAQEAVKRLKLGEIRKKKIVIKNGTQNSLRCKVHVVRNLSAVT